MSEIGAFDVWQQGVDGGEVIGMYNHSTTVQSTCSHPTGDGGSNDDILGLPLWAWIVIGVGAGVVALTIVGIVVTFVIIRRTRWGKSGEGYAPLPFD